MGCECCGNVSNSQSPVTFTGTSTETSTGNLIGAGEVVILNLSVSPIGIRQVKLDSMSEVLLLTDDESVYSYDIRYRLRRSDLPATPLAELQIINGAGGNPGVTSISQVPNLSWNDTLSSPIIYTITVEVVTSINITSIIAGTRSLHATVFNF